MYGGVSRWNRLLVAGVMSGVLQVVAGVAMYLTGVYFEPISFWVSLFALAAGIALGTAWYTRPLGDVRLTYGRAVAVGVAIAVCTGLTYAVYNIVSVSFFYPDFIEDMVQARVLRLQARLTDVPPAQLLERVRTTTTLGRVVVSNIIGLSATGTILSLVSALGFRGRRDT